jgi:acyl carrier protein
VEKLIEKNFKTQLNKMEINEILNQANTIFCKVLKNTSVELNENTTAHDVDGWDSLSNIILIGELEKHFNIKFKLREIMKMKNVGDLCTNIQKKVA